MPKSYTIRAATDKQLERIKEFQDGCPDFGFHNLRGERWEADWTADTLAERSKVLLEYIDEFGTKFYEDIAYTKGWNDYTDLSITTITRRAQPLVEYVLADPAWLGTDGSDSDCWGGLDAGKEFKFLYVGLIRLLCSVRGIQDPVSYSDWFSHYDPTQTGFFGINGCDGDNKCHTVPNPVGPKQPDGHRVAPVVQAKRAVEISPDSIFKHMTSVMTEPDAQALVRKLMSEFSIKEQKPVFALLEKPTEDMTFQEQSEIVKKQYPLVYEKAVKDQKSLKTQRKRVNAMSKKDWEMKKRIKELEEEIEEVKETYHQRGFDAGREEYEVDTELLEKKDEEIEQLKEQLEKLKATEDSEEETEEIEYPDRDWRCMFELGAYNMMRGEMDAEYKKCWGLLLTKKIKTYQDWMDLEL